MKQKLQHNSMQALKKNVYALLRMWGMTAHKASLAMGERGSFITEIFRSDRGSITLGRLDELAEYLNVPPDMLIRDDSSQSEEESEISG
ncbi:MAG: helix-turn-helix domain-containing protein [Planctomycetota bacterium]|jgi:transcriptional regulator with XRE-family HTH domain